jgi:hypothetical protein
MAYASLALGLPTSDDRTEEEAATTHPLALSSAEQDRLLGVLDSERFADIAPATFAR